MGWIYYDDHAGLNDPPVHGAVSKTSDWLDTNGSGQPDAGDGNPTASVMHDGYGNIVGTVNARGFATAVAFDPLMHQLPMTVTNALGHQTLYSYRAAPSDGAGAVDGYLLLAPNAVTDPNGQATRTAWDA